jgi:hypothetical protein
MEWIFLFALMIAFPAFFVWSELRHSRETEQERLRHVDYENFEKQHSDLRRQAEFRQNDLINLISEFPELEIEKKEEAFAELLQQGMPTYDWECLYRKLRSDSPFKSRVLSIVTENKLRKVEER